MKSLLLALTLAVAAAGLATAPHDAEAKRLGGGRPAGMQRQAPAQPANATPHAPAQPAQNAGAQPAAPQPAAPPATPPKRSWTGPLAGLAAGLGIAALASHFGMGGALASGIGSLLMFGLLALVAVVAVRFVMSRIGSQRNGGLQPAGAGAGGWQAPTTPAWQPPRPATPAPLERVALPSGAASTAAALPVATAATLPGGMAHDDFIRLAKMVFIRLQAANDAGNIDDLRKFTTPELFASLRLDVQDRGNVAQQTDVVKLDAEVADVAQQDGQDIVSVRFHGLIRETAGAGAEPFNELWHLVRPASGQGDWAIAGITPQA